MRIQINRKSIRLYNKLKKKKRKEEKIKEKKRKN